MTAMKGQAKDKLMVIKLFSINYARDLLFHIITLFKIIFYI